MRFNQVILLLAAFATGLIQPRQDQPRQDQKPRAGNWEQEIAKLEERQKTETVPDGIVFYGSSSIRLWDSITELMAPWPAIQRGFGGAKLPDTIEYAPRILGPHLGKDNPNRCRAVVIFVANDIAGDPGSDATPEEVANRFNRLLSWIRQKDPEMPVFWIEVTPTPSRWHVWNQIQAGTRKIRSILDKDPNAWFIPTAGAYLDAKGMPDPSLFRDDRLHLNAEGYQIWAALIKSQLQLRLDRSSEPTSLSSMIRPLQRSDRLFVYRVPSRRRGGGGEMIAAQTLQGVLARTDRPRLWLDVGDQTFVNYLKESFDIDFDTRFADNFSGLLGELRQYTSGNYVLFDLFDTASISAATTMAGLLDAVAIDVRLEPVARENGYSMAMDVRGKDCVWVAEQFGQQLNRNGIVVHTNDRRHHPSAWFLRDWGPATQTLDWWHRDSELSMQTYQNLTPGSPVYGWQDPNSSDEGVAIRLHSEAGLFQVPSDWMLNLSVHASLGKLAGQQPLKQKIRREDPAQQSSGAEQNVHYVTFILSDMDNILTEIGTSSFFGSPRYFGNSHRGEFPMSWGMAPALVDLSPAGMEMWYKAASPNDAFIAYCGPGYFFPSHAPELDSYTQRLQRYVEQADLRTMLIIDRLEPERSLDQSYSQVAKSFTSIDSLRGLFFLDYARYAPYDGKIYWFDGKPLVTARFDFRSDPFYSAVRTSPESLARSINALPTDPSSEDSYTVVTVHAWSRDLDDIAATVALLEPDVRVVHAEEFIELLRANLGQEHR